MHRTKDANLNGYLACFRSDLLLVRVTFRFFKCTSEDSRLSDSLLLVRDVLLRERAITGIRPKSQKSGMAGIESQTWRSPFHWGRRSATFRTASPNQATGDTGSPHTFNTWPPFASLTWSLYNPFPCSNLWHAEQNFLRRVAPITIIASKANPICFSSQLVFLLPPEVGDGLPRSL